MSVLQYILFFEVTFCSSIYLLSLYRYACRLFLLADGRCVYFGERTEAVPYFSMLGYTCPDTFSPADYLIDLLAIRPGIEAACLDRVVVRKQMKKISPPPPLFFKYFFILVFNFKFLSARQFFRGCLFAFFLIFITGFYPFLSISKI